MARYRAERISNQRMKPRISIITLGVKDLEKSLAFYRDGLGLQTNGIIGTEFKGDETHPAGAIVLFELQRGLILSLYPRAELAKDAKEPIGVSSPTEFSIGHLVQNKEEVDSLMKRAESAGAIVTGKPHERPWGIYSGYFKDLDGHLWEIIWNPQMLPD
jgi:uncharacterized protein